MTGMKGLALVTLMVSGVALASGAYANEASPATCIHLAKQVSTVISQATPGPKVDEAKKMARNARSFCSAQWYEKGSALYEKTLSLLSKN